MNLLICSHSNSDKAQLLKSLSVAATLSKGSCSSLALSIISQVEFHLVLTSSIRFLGGIPAASHCLENLSRHCGDARILAMSLRSYNENKE